MFTFKCTFVIKAILRKNYKPNFKKNRNYCENADLKLTNDELIKSYKYPGFIKNW